MRLCGGTRSDEAVAGGAVVKCPILHLIGPLVGVSRTKFARLTREVMVLSCVDGSLGVRGGYVFPRGCVAGTRSPRPTRRDARATSRNTSPPSDAPHSATRPPFPSLLLPPPLQFLWYSLWMTGDGLVNKLETARNADCDGPQEPSAKHAQSAREFLRWKATTEPSTPFLEARRSKRAGESFGSLPGAILQSKHMWPD